MSGVVLVTGASGTLGSKVVVALRANGWRTRALAHKRQPEGADEIVWGDLASPQATDDAVAGVDAVVHLAAVTHARKAEHYDRVNVQGTAELLQAAERAAVPRFVHVSTRAISADGGAYSDSKRRAEELVERARINATIVRLPEVYGGEGREGIDRMIALARRGRRVPVVGRGLAQVCPIHIADAVAALVNALESSKSSGKVYTLAGPCLSLEEVVRVCAEAFETSSRPLRVPIFLMAAAGWSSRFLPIPVYPDQLARLRAPKAPPTPEAATDLGFRPRSLLAGIRAQPD